MATIAAGCDHGGFSLKTVLIEHLVASGHEVLDLGTHSNERVDYPDFAETVAKSVASGEVEFGLLVCGSGIGVCMAANKVSGIRAATIHDVTSAHLSREHNDANVICLGERLIGPEVAKEALDIFLASEFQEGRHLNRVKKINEIL
ncbi:MAG TPA: ribose 5-phosphate isomerase B [Acidimicrobiaceae bacterium]|jgi:ribose 5-phosphate isomerase B|nr:ribose 5-phosphate isomerase B [Acidimicrobiaceae bacterium]|tara:strand:- start:1281 stop:1718 length:438 start_codon:yes stop_codon:yes gene_type:complete